MPADCTKLLTDWLALCEARDTALVAWADAEYDGRPKSETDPLEAAYDRAHAAATAADQLAARALMQFGPTEVNGTLYHGRPFGVITQDLIDTVEWARRIREPAHAG